ncbi:MAG: glycogen/starch synthase [Nanohaloarchaea archaeon]|nr:glycogen/starch synthase [Candidatus Nanohaloarchaea archaeon]
MQPDNFLEVSFEVANKVGGIHQVLKSKAGKMKQQYGENYVAIGRYDPESDNSEFVPRECPQFAENLTDLEGIEIHCGVWNVPGSPRCILVDPSGMEKDIEEIKQELWEEHGIDSMNAGHDFDEPVKWSYAVGKVVEKLAENMEGETVVQAHEWLSGPAILNNDLPSVFTTHATFLGRVLSNSDYDLESAVEEGNIDQSRAEQHGVKCKHQMEKTSASEADVFTTVSQNTGREAEAVLETKPDVILPNGFNVEDFPSLEELSYEHKKKKQNVKEFLRAYFKPYYDVDLENDPRILFTSGRYEFRNKGVDVFIDALSKLNQQEGEDFFVFILVPTDTKGPNKEILENVSLYDELDDYIESVLPEVRSRMLDTLTSGDKVVDELEEIFSDNSATLDSLRKNFMAKEGRPPLSAFELNYAEDEILETLWEKGLRNREEDRVKVVFYPTYLSVGDRLLSMDYNDFMVASSAGIFPSYYEPWGYTPVETAANGALSITTDMAGFGKYLKENSVEEERKGIKVLERAGREDEEVSEDLAQMLDDFVSYEKTEITERKHNARKLAQLTSWNKLAENYFEAHSKALGE